MSTLSQRGCSDRPSVTLKFAQTLDGRIATVTGHSQWISGPEARVLAHRLRAEHDAVMVGVGTVLADDPQLTVRLCEGRDPLRIVVDSHLRTPLRARVLTENPASTIVVTTAAAPSEAKRAIQAAGARVVEAEGKVETAKLESTLSRLWSLGIRSVLIEGGSKVITSALRAGLVDVLVVITAPKIVGSGKHSVGDLGIRSMDQALCIEWDSVELVGNDLVTRGRVVRRE